MASTRIHTVVPAETEATAIEKAHTVFETLCPGGAVPVFDSYRLAQENGSPFTAEITDGTTDITIESIWRGTIETLTEKEPGDHGVYDPDTAARARLYRLYDEHARPVLSRPHYSVLMDQDDLWHLAAIVKY